MSNTQKKYWGFYLCWYIYAWVSFHFEKHALSVFRLVYLLYIAGHIMTRVQLIYIYLHSQCLSPLTLLVRFSSVARCTQYKITSLPKVCFFLHLNIDWQYITDMLLSFNLWYICTLLDQLKCFLRYVHNLLFAVILIFTCTFIFSPLLLQYVLLPFI